MDGSTDRRTDRHNFSLFYRTLSPVGAAALLLFETSQTSKKQGTGTADLMMPFGDWFFSKNRICAITLAINIFNPEIVFVLTCHLVTVYTALSIYYC